MSEEHNADETGTVERNASVNRRRFVKALGIAGGGTLIPSFSVTASAESIDAEEVRRSSSVKTLFDALNNPIINNQKAKITKGENTVIAHTSFETDFGRLVHAEFRSSDHPEIDPGTTTVHFDFDDIAEISRHKLPTKFRDLPTGVTTSLIYNEGEAILRRNVSDEEKRQLASAVDTDEFTAVYAEDLNGYYIQTESGPDYQLTIDSSGQIDTRNPSLKLVDQVTTNDFGDACFDCAASGGCQFCGPKCIPSITNLPGCAYCIYQNCRDLDAGVCGRCIREVVPVVIV